MTPARRRAPALSIAPHGSALLPAVSLSSLDTVHCMGALALLRGLGDASIDMILTSPPYDNLRQYKGYSWNFEAIAHQMYRVLKPGGVAVWVVGDSVVDGSETLNAMRQALYFVGNAGFCMHDTMIWQKPKGGNPNIAQHKNRYQGNFEYMFVLSKGPRSEANLIFEENVNIGKAKKAARQRQPNGKLVDYSGGAVYVTAECSPLSNVWYIPTGWGHSTLDAIAFDHPATFPEELARRHIATWSNPGDTVLDFFMGSGTTAKVARNLSRHYIGCDISAEYVALARRRLADTDPYQSTVLPTGAIQHSLFEGLA